MLTPKDCDDASKSFRRLSIMISNLIEYLKRSGMKGSKFTTSNQAKNSKPSIPSETLNDLNDLNGLNSEIRKGETTYERQ